MENEIMNNEELVENTDLMAEEEQSEEGGSGLGVAILLGIGAGIGVASKTAYDKWLKPKVQAVKESRAAKKAAKKAAEVVVDQPAEEEDYED